MKALSLMPEWAMSVLLGWKTVECRTWKTDYRGELLICASSKAWPGSIAKHALCIVNLVDIVPFEKKHLEAAGMDVMPEEGSYAWVFDGGEWVEPFEVKGKLHIFDVPDEKIKTIPPEIDNVTALKKYYEPLMTWSNRTVPEEEVRAWWNDVLAEQGQIAIATENDSGNLADVPESVEKQDTKKKSVDSPTSPLKSEYVEYRIAKEVELAKTSLSKEEYLDSDEDEIAKRLEKAIDAEAPIELSRLCKLVQHSFGITRANKDIKAKTEAALQTVPHKESPWNSTIFIWQDSQEPSEYKEARCYTPVSARSAEQIPFEEICNAMELCLRERGGLARAELISFASAKFGYKRTGASIEKVFNRALDDALKQGRFSESLDIILLAPRKG